MKLLEFAVTGYKNLSREVRLTYLGRVNVIHGDNNVGKSNLLEAINLFFALVGEGFPSFELDDARLFALTEHRIGEIFDVRGPVSATIHLEALLSIPALEINQAGIQVGYPTDPVRIYLSLRRDHGRSRLTVTVSRITTASGGDVTPAPGSQTPNPYHAYGIQLLRYIARNPLVHDPNGRPSFALIEENRRVRGRAEPLSPSIISPATLLALWDASTSADPQQIGRFKLLKDLVRLYLPPFKEGELLVAFDRNRNEAFAMHEGPNNVRLRHHLLGSGVQQVLGLLALLLTTDARMVAVEEPECNLRYTLQLRLREAFDALTQDERGPQQLFLASHSPAFETEAYFYAMRIGDDGAPLVERRPVRDARKFVAHDLQPPPADATGEVAWVSSEGLVQLPPRILPQLEVESGGEVAFVRNEQTKRLEILSERQFLDLLGPDEATESA